MSLQSCRQSLQIEPSDPRKTRATFGTACPQKAHLSDALDTLPGVADAFKVSRYVLAQEKHMYTVGPATTSFFTPLQKEQVCDSVG